MKTSFFNRGKRLRFMCRWTAIQAALDYWGRTDRRVLWAAQVVGHARQLWGGLLCRRHHAKGTWRDSSQRDRIV